MKCNGSGQRSDLIGPESNWSRLDEETPAILSLYECTEYGCVQRSDRMELVAVGRE